MRSSIRFRWKNNVLVYDRYAIPELLAGVPTSSTLGGAGRIDFKKPHPPLLITAGEKDHIVPAVLNKSNFNKYKASSSVTEFKEFAGTRSLRHRRKRLGRSGQLQLDLDRESL